MPVASQAVKIAKTVTGSQDEVRVVERFTASEERVLSELSTNVSVSYARLEGWAAACFETPTSPFGQGRLLSMRPIETYCVTGLKR
jgi:hypothetical protein